MQGDQVPRGSLESEYFGSAKSSSVVPSRSQRSCLQLRVFNISTPSSRSLIRKWSRTLERRQLLCEAQAEFNDVTGTSERS